MCVCVCVCSCQFAVFLFVCVLSCLFSVVFIVLTECTFLSWYLSTFYIQYYIFVMDKVIINIDKMKCLLFRSFVRSLVLSCVWLVACLLPCLLFLRFCFVLFLSLVVVVVVVVRKLTNNNTLEQHFSITHVNL